MKFNQNIILKIQNDFLNLKYEVCGHVRVCKDELFLININKGEDITKEKRGSCSYTSYGKYIWHTHPNISKFYPSKEDISKCIKKRNGNLIDIQFIFTQWGIWEIYVKNKQEINKEINDQLNTFKKEVNAWLYYKTSKGREMPTEAVLKKYLYLIKYYFRKFNLKISFTRWDIINNKGYYKSKFVKAT